MARLDFDPSRHQPGVARLARATIAAVGASLLACAGLVAAGKAVFPSTQHFSHFRFSDYATLAVLGVLGACAGWPVVTRITSAPRWLFLRLAVAVTLVLWLPDAWLFARGESAPGVGVLMVMHLAIALLTYNALVRLAPVRAEGAHGEDRTAEPGAPAPARSLSARTVRHAWSAMALLVGVELVVGVVTIVLVPYTRAAGVVPQRNGWVFVLHGGIGVVLGAGALAVLAVSAAADRLARIGAVLGALGVGIGLVGGALATVHSGRLLGVGLMLVGVVMAGIGYLVPAMEELGRAERERAERERAERERAIGSGLTYRRTDVPPD